MRVRSAISVILTLVMVALLVLLIFVLINATTVEKTEDKLNITVDTGKIERASEEAVRKTGETLERTGEKLQRESPEPD